MKLSRIFSLCLAASLLTGAPAAAADAGKDITVIVMALNSDYWHMVEAGAKLAGQDLGYNVNVIGPNAETDAIGQANMVEDAAANKVAAIVLAPNDPVALIPAVGNAKAAGVPVVVIDMALTTQDESLYESFIGTDNYEAGGMAAGYLIKKLPSGCEVAIIRGIVGSSNHDGRCNGASDAFKAAGVKVVSIQPADSERGKAVTVAENVLQTNPGIKAIYCTNDEMALGAYQAVANIQKQKDILVMGFDGSFGALDSIEAGELTASLAQMPIDMGYSGVKAAVDFLAGKKLEKRIKSATVIVDKANLAKFKADIKEKLSKAN
ncbi:MAG: sugar ABC transporter substrate-binding protein [Planctomycetota bacterium]|jgi:ribose transport system substrate-binding protein|nr:sugar ABC transporter substrate-binding protein [Planctomycetota bacterium]